MAEQLNNHNLQEDTPKPQAKRGRKEIYDEVLSDDSNGEIKNILLVLSQKMDTLNDNMSAVDIRLNQRIDALEATMSNKVQTVKDDMENRIQSVSNELDQRIANALESTIKKCDENTRNVMKGVS